MNTELQSEIGQEPTCSKCGTVINPSATFCGNCGAELTRENHAAVREDVFSILSPALGYYFVTLFLLAMYKLTDIFPDGFEGLAIVTFLDITVVIVFFIYQFEAMKPVLSFKGFSFTVAALTIAGALAGSVFISWFARLIEISISDDVFYNPYLFQDTQQPFLFSILFICVQPAIFEEVAFRGFLYTNVEKVSSALGAVYVTSFIFGIIHLAFISLIWLVPIGLAFAFLRRKYNILWYGVIGHFTYNFGIIALEFLGWF